MRSKEQGGQGVPDKKPSGAKRAAALRAASKVVPGLDKIPPVSRFLDEHPQSSSGKETAAILQKLSDNPLLGISAIFANTETVTNSSNLDPDKKVSIVTSLSQARKVLDLNQHVIVSTVAQKPIFDKAQAVKNFLENLTTAPSNQVMQRLDSKARRDWGKGNLIRIGLLETATDTYKLIMEQIRKTGLPISDRAFIRILNERGVALETEREGDRIRVNLVLKKAGIQAVLDDFIKKSEEEKRAKEVPEAAKQVVGKV